MCQREQQMRNMGSRRDDDEEPPNQRARYEPGDDDRDQDSVSLVLEELEVSVTVQTNENEENPEVPPYWLQDPSSRWMEENYFNENNGSESDQDLSLIGSEESIPLNDWQRTESNSSLSDEIREESVSLDQPESPEQLVPTETEPEQSGFYFPLSSVGQVYEFNEFLAENMSNLELMIEILVGAAAGGERSIVEATGRIMAEILINSVAAQFSWDGAVSGDGVYKIPFDTSLSILQAVIGAVQRIIPGATEDEIKNKVKSWLESTESRLESPDTTDCMEMK